MEGFVTNNQFPQSLVIYIKTNIPKHGYITYTPNMTDPKTHDSLVSFTPQVKLNKECVATFVTKKGNKDVSSVFFNASEFKNLARFCASHNKMASADFVAPLKAYTDQGNVANNVQITLNTLFKKDSVIHLDNQPYVIYSSTFDAQAWQVDTKPLHLIPHNLIATADKEYDALNAECPDCINGAQANTKPLNVDRDGSRATKSPQLLELPVSAAMAVCDIRTFFYLTESSIAFPSSLISKYVKAFNATTTATTSVDVTYDVILANYKQVFLAMIDILRYFLKRVVAAATATEETELIVQCATLDVSIYTAFTEVNFGELIGVLLNIPSTISSIDRDNMDVKNHQKTLLAIQSYFAFHKCIKTNAFLIKSRTNKTQTNFLLEQKLVYEYCRLLENVYYFQDQFIHIYLTPLLIEFDAAKQAACLNKTDAEPLTQTCLNNIHSEKITTMVLHLFIQSARQNYLEDYCETAHKPSTLDKKCEKILKTFSKDVMDTKQKKEIESLFEKLVYTTDVEFNGETLFVFDDKALTKASAKASTKVLSKASINENLQLLMKLHVRLHNKVCGGVSDWTLKTSGNDESDDESDDDYIRQLARSNDIRVIVLDEDGTTILQTELDEDNDEDKDKDEKNEENQKEYFILASHRNANDGVYYYRPALTQSRVMFPSAIMVGGSLQRQRQRQRQRQYVVPSLRMREKAALDAKQQIYKPSLLAYYVEISLELFPKNDHVADPKKSADPNALATQKQSFICNKRRIAIQTSLQSVKQGFKTITSAATSLMKDITDPLYAIPSIAYVEAIITKSSTNASTVNASTVDVNASTVNVRADDNIHEIMRGIHDTTLSIANAVHGANVSVLLKN